MSYSDNDKRRFMDQIDRSKEFDPYVLGERIKENRTLKEVVGELDQKAKKFILEQFKNFMETYSSEKSELKQKLMSNPEILRIMLKLQQELRVENMQITIPRRRANL